MVAVGYSGLIALLAAAPDTEVVGEAGTGREALDRMDELSPDVVLIDIRMPEIDGIEVTRQLRADHPDVEVVMLTMLKAQRHESSRGTPGRTTAARTHSSCVPSGMSGMKNRVNHRRARSCP